MFDHLWANDDDITESETVHDEHVEPSGREHPRTGSSHHEVSVLRLRLGAAKKTIRELCTASARVAEVTEPDFATKVASTWPRGEVRYQNTYVRLRNDYIDALCPPW